MKRIYRIGITDTGNRRASVFVKAIHDNDELSLTGVVRPTRGGNCLGSCGQITIGLEPADITPVGEWTLDKIKRLWEIWNEWHLNHMRPNCEHQTGPDWDPNREITTYHYVLKQTVVGARCCLKDTVMATLKNKGTVRITDTEQELLGLDHELCLPTPSIPDCIKHYYEPRKYDNTVSSHVETTTSGKTLHTNHPMGILCKPCPVCGYQWGTEWKHVSVPESILKELEAFPKTDKEPAWV